MSARALYDKRARHLGHFVLLPGATDRRVIEHVSLRPGTSIVRVTTRFNDDRSVAALDPDAEVTVFS